MIREVDGSLGSCSMEGFVIRGVKTTSSAIILCAISATIKTAFFFSYFLTDFALVAPVYYGGNKAEILLYLGGVYLGLMEPYNGQPSRTIMMKNVDKVGWV